jgi:hypothetical protein
VDLWNDDVMVVMMESNFKDGTITLLNIGRIRRPPHAGLHGLMLGKRNTAKIRGSIQA